MDRLPRSWGSGLAPLYHSNLGIEQGAELEPNSFDSLKITFPFKIIQKRCILPAVTQRPCSDLLNRRFRISLFKDEVCYALAAL